MFLLPRADGFSVGPRMNAVSLQRRGAAPGDDNMRCAPTTAPVLQTEFLRPADVL